MAFSFLSLATAVVQLHAVPIALDSTNPINRTNGTVRIVLGGANVQNTITIAEDRTNNQIVITGKGVPNYTPTILGFNVTDGWNTPTTISTSVR